MKRKVAEKKVIGRYDKVDLPGLGLKNIEAKIDTGAYTSALHCHNVVSFVEDGLRMVTFNLLDPGHKQYNEMELTFPVHTKRTVKNSFGDREERITILTEVVIFGETKAIEISLSDRSDMKYPVLIGRKFLKRDFVVDVNKKNVSYRRKRKNRKRKI